MSDLFPGFQVEDVPTSGTVIHTLKKGSGPPVLLLHGYPETHVIWHKIADRLAEQYTVVLTDLRGYGNSGKPEGGERHSNYSFRSMALDQYEVMQHFRFDSFAVVSHDRGSRVAHRLCLDFADHVSKVCFMDIVPTLTMYSGTNKEFASKYVWWFLLIQKEPLPERLIGCDPKFFLDHIFAIQNGTPGAITPEALAAYGESFIQPETIHATCEDYRASAEIDLEMDQEDIDAGRKVSAPILALWGSKGTVGKLWDVLDVWRAHAHGSVTGKAIDAGHHLPEERPDDVLSEVMSFLSS